MITPKVAVAALWGFLLSPVLFIPVLSIDTYPLDDLFIFNLLASLFWAGLLISLIVRPAFFHLIALPLYISTCVDLFLLVNFGARLSSSYLGVIVNDVGETRDFLSTYFWSLSPFLLFMIVGYPYLLFKAWRLRLRKIHLKSAIVFAVGLCALYVAAGARTLRNGGEFAQSVDALVAKEASAPLGVIAQGYSAFKQMSDSADLVRSRRNRKILVDRAPYVGSEVYVWVIGESSRPQNWSLFGYSKATTPLLAERRGLIALPDVVTTAPLTSVAVPSMLSLAPISDWNAILKESSVVGVFRELGFQTAWLSTQEADVWAGIIPQIANEADQTRFFDHAHDAALLEPIRKIIDGLPNGAKLFLVVHTKGSHFEYSRRYPAEYARFGGNNPSLKDTYDNSVLYTDWFLDKVIDILAAKQYRSALVYISDHGENLRDDSRRLLGHSIGNEYDLRVPALLWFSDAFWDAHREQICDSTERLVGALSSSDLSHSFLDLLGASSRDIDEHRSVFSRQFHPHKREFMLNGELHTFSEPAAKRKSSIVRGCNMALNGLSEPLVTGR